MKILVLSDSHGETDSLEQAYLTEKPDCVIFLGDGIRDFLQVRDGTMGGEDTYLVLGNCDRGSADEYYWNQTVTLGGHRVYLTHGFREHVKGDYLGLYEESLSREADVALFGHTHYQDLVRWGSVTLVNPGTVGYGDYAVILLENGKEPEVQLKNTNNR